MGVCVVLTNVLGREGKGREGKGLESEGWLGRRGPTSVRSFVSVPHLHPQHLFLQVELIDRNRRRGGVNLGAKVELVRQTEPADGGVEVRVEAADEAGGD